MVRRSTRVYLKWILLTLTAVVVFSMATFLYRTFSFFRNIGVVVEQQIINKPKPVFTVALLGYGGPQHEGGYLTDTIMVISVNYEAKKVLLVSVPRDLWVKLPTRSGVPFAAKINTVYQLQLFPGTFPDVNVKKYTQNDNNGLIKKVLGDVTGLTIDSYVAVDFEAFTKLIDLLSGVDINLESGFEDREYPVTGKETDLCGHEESELPELEKIATESMVLAFPCRYETISFAAGNNHMDGKTALKFARSRHSEIDGGDFARAKRQQMVIQAVSDKLLSPVYFPKISRIMDELENNVKTDINYRDLTRLLKQAPQSNQYRLLKLILSIDNFLKADYSDDGQYVLIPKQGDFQWTKIKQKIQKLNETEKTNSGI